MMKTEYAENSGFLQRDSVEHKEYAEACRTESQEVDRKDGANLLEDVLCRDNLNKAYKRVKTNKGTSGVDGMSVEVAQKTRCLSSEKIARRKEKVAIVNESRRKYPLDELLQLSGLAHSTFYYYHTKELLVGLQIIC